MIRKHACGHCGEVFDLRNEVLSHLKYICSHLGFDEAKIHNTLNSYKKKRPEYNNTLLGRGLCESCG